MFKTYLSILSITFAIVSINPFTTNAQCLSSNLQGTCSGGNGVLTNNVVINTGNNYYWSTGTATRNINNFNSGGILTICGGSLSLSGNYNGGTIIIQENATLTLINTANFGNNFTIINYGVLNVNTNLTLQGNNTVLINQVTGVINVQSGFTTFLSSGARMANYNQANLGDLVIQGDDRTALCLGAGAVVDVRNITNNVANSVDVGGKSCISVENDMNFNQPISTKSDLLICYRRNVGINNDTMINLGAAQLLLNCDNCGIALPIELISFEAKLNNRQVDIHWATASEQNNDFFTIERSADGLNWEIVTTAAGAGNSIYRIDYAAYDSRPLSGISYYRLKQTDFDGAFEYSNIVSVFNGNEAVQLIKVINIMGQEVEQNAKGLVILVFSNGETLKIINE